MVTFPVIFWWLSNFIDRPHDKSRRSLVHHVAFIRDEPNRRQMGSIRFHCSSLSQNRFLHMLPTSQTNQVRMESGLRSRSSKINEF